MVTRKRNTRRSPRARKKQSTGIPKWLWMLICIAVGVVVAYSRDIADMFNHKSSHPQAQVASTQPVVTAPAPKPKLKPAEVITLIPPEVPPKYDFYTRLPKDEVIIPKRDYQQIRKPKAPLQDTPAKAATPKGDGNYVLQVGSFRTNKDAERRKANLILMGMRPKVQSVTTDTGKWYRVRLGPFDSRNKMNQIRTELHSKKIQTFLVSGGQ